MKHFSVWIVAGLGGLLLSGCAFFGTSSVGVIGGSDGPTAVFVSSKLAPGVSAVLIPAVILAVLVAAGIVAYVLHRRKK